MILRVHWRWAFPPRWGWALARCDGLDRTCMEQSFNVVRACPLSLCASNMLDSSTRASQLPSLMTPIPSRASPPPVTIPNPPPHAFRAPSRPSHPPATAARRFTLLAPPAQSSPPNKLKLSHLAHARAGPRSTQRKVPGGRKYWEAFKQVHGW